MAPFLLIVKLTLKENNIKCRYIIHKQHSFETKLQMKI